MSTLQQVPGVHVVGSETLTAALLVDYESAGWSTAVVDLAEASDKAAIMEAFVHGLGLPDWFGRNWDALDDALRDLSWWPPGSSGRLLAVLGTDGVATACDRTMIEDVLASAAEDWAGTEAPLVVLTTEETSMPTGTPQGHRATYRPPSDGIVGREDYPNAPISLVLDRTTPGADLFGVAVAIGGDIPLHLHSMMEFQFVVSGTGLALNADGAEIPISPGGTVVSPARAAGAHGFRNTGPLPLTLLCIYPSPGGATPDRSPFDESTPPDDGPRTTYVGPADMRPAATPDPGIIAAHILDSADPGAELFAELVSITGELPRHHHPVFELQYVLAGSGTAIDADGTEVVIGPGGVLACPAGPSGAHGFRNTGTMPLQLLCVYASAGGEEPARTVLPG